MHFEKSTQWGEEFDLDSETSVINHTLEHFQYSVERSLSRLPKIDLLYIHKADIDVLSDLQIRDAMEFLVKNGKVSFTGASISDGSVLADVVRQDLLWSDFIQTSAEVVRTKPDLIKNIFGKGIAIVVNTPIRNLSKGVPPKDSYLEIVNNPHVSIILTGTRNHLKETIGYFVPENN